MAKDAILSFRISSEKLEEFRKESDKRGISQSDLFAEYQQIYKEKQSWLNPYFRTNELYKLVTLQIQELQNYDFGAEQSENYVEDEIMEGYLRFLNNLDDEIRRLPTYWERQYKMDSEGDWVLDENYLPIPDDEGNERPW